jgi:hypothetical protein
VSGTLEEVNDPANDNFEFLRREGSDFLKDDARVRGEKLVGTDIAGFIQASEREVVIRQPYRE